MSGPGLAPDGALATRDVVLDPEAMAPRIARALSRGEPLAAGWCTRRRVKYRVGEGIRVLYSVELGGEERLVSLRTFPAGRAERVLRRCAPAAVQAGPVSGIGHEPELGAVLFAFPNDRKVGGLRELVEGRRAGVAASYLVAYAPEKGATVRRVAADGRTVAYAKAYAGEEGRRTGELHDALRGPAAAAGLRLPRALEYREDERILECEAVAGRPLAELDGAELGRGMLGLGAVLAGLHRLEPPAATAAFDRFTPSRLRRAAQVIAAVRPDCAGAAQELAERLVAEPPPPAARVCLHGDLHAKNALVGTGVALVDLDQVAVGPAVADLAGMLAALRYRRLTGAGDGTSESELADALLRGYHGAGGRLDSHGLRWHLAAALLVERALRAITRVRAAGLAALGPLLAEADAALGAPAIEVAA